MNLWGLDAIKTKGESVAVALHMVGARPVREGTGRIARCASLELHLHFCSSASLHCRVLTWTNVS